MKFNVGDAVVSKEYGKGTCIQVDEANLSFTYLFSFKKDGVKIWLGKKYAEKNVKKAA